MTQSAQLSAVRQRRLELYYMKTIAIFLMAMQHSMECLANFDYEVVAPVGVFQHAMEFSWEFLCAGIFLFTIGFGVIYTRKQSPVQMAKRGLKLLADAYLLNIARGVLPLLLFWLVKGELDREMLFVNLFTVDVLHFAAIAYLIMALLKQCRISRSFFLPIAFLMLSIWPFVMEPMSQIESPMLRAALDLFVRCDDLSIFPFLNYFIYVTVGMMAAEFFAGRKRPVGFYRMLLLYMAVFWTGVLLYGYANGVSIRAYYDLSCQQDLPDFQMLILEATLMLGEFALFHLLHRHVRENGKAFELICFCGTKLTSIYIVHWIMIGWLSAVVRMLGWEGWPFEITALISVGITLISIGIVKLITKGRKSSHGAHA